MLVKELVEELLKMPPDVTVIADGPDAGGYDVCWGVPTVELVKRHVKGQDSGGRERVVDDLKLEQVVFISCEPIQW